LSSSAFCYSKRGQRTLDGYKLRQQEPPSFCADDDEPIVALTLWRSNPAAQGEKGGIVVRRARADIF
jgi:hypothetical protein